MRISKAILVSALVVSVSGVVGAWNFGGSPVDKLTRGAYATSKQNP